MFFVFAAISTVWADDPALALKRWIKGLGNLVMALVIVSEKRPDQALGFILRRIAFIFLPLSVLFIKYYPDLGRQYHMGMPMFSGAALTKNALGQLCFIVATYFLWELVLPASRARPARDRIHFGVFVVLVPVVVWLLYMANSATSYVCLAVASSVLLIAKLPALRRLPRRLVTVGVGLVIGLAVLETIFGIKDLIIVALGRRPDLTDRDEIWHIVLSMDTNPLIGVGYESFWTGQRALQVWEKLGVSGINQAHNGYIELYLNLGAIGLFLLTIGIVKGFARMVKDLTSNFPYAVLRFALIVAVLTYNYTEATFVPVSNTFVLLLVAALGTRMTQSRSAVQATRRVPPDPSDTWRIAASGELMRNQPKTRGSK